MTELQHAAVFVGRDRELSELLAGLHDATSGQGRLFLLFGEPGIGKSRLADQLASRARDEGVRVLVGRCWDDAGAPAYWPWMQSLRMLIRGTDEDVLRRQLGSGAEDIAQMVPDLRELYPDLTPLRDIESESARFQLFDSVTSFLRRAAQDGPLLIVVDDLHAADTPSLLFLRFLGSQLADAAIMVIGTYRDVELLPDAPLTDAVGEVARQPSTRMVGLSGLGEGPVGQFIQSAAGVTPGRRLAAALARETGGNPLFLGESVRLLAAEGRLDEVAASQALHLPVPRGIRDVIARRMRHLPDATVDVLVHAAALGPEFSADVLRRVGDAPSDDVLDRLGEAARAGLIVPVPGALDRFRFAHDLIRETLYDSLAPARRVRLHRRIADTLEALHGAARDAYLAELAHHFYEACRGGDDTEDGAGGAADSAARYAREAGDQALRSLAFEEASRLYRMALAVLDHHAPDATAERTEVLLRLGDAVARGGDLPSSRETFLVAADLARRTGAAEGLARAALGYGGRFFWARVGHDPHLIPLLQDALVMLGGTNEGLRIRLLTRLACAWRSDRERQEQRRAMSEQAVAMARTLDDPAALSYALAGFFWAAWLQDNAHERLTVATEMLGVAEAAGDAERAIDAHLMLFLVLMDLGRVSEARVRMETVVRLAGELRQPAQLWLTWANRTVFALLEGDFARAEETIAQEAEPGHPTTPIHDDVSAVRMHRFLLRREQGRGAEEEASVRAAVEEFPWYPLHRSALVCLLLDAGRTDEARAAFDDMAADEFRMHYPDCEWMLGIPLASEACAMLGDASAASILYRQLLPFAGGHAIGHTEGSIGAVDRYLGLLAGTLGMTAEAERHLDAAIAANERMGAWPWAAHARHDLARLLARRAGPGDRDRADALDRSALASARRLGMTALESAIEGGHGPAHQELVERPSSRATFRREGEYWTVQFEGDPFRIRDMKGMRHLARLLAEPGRELHALDLAGAARPDAREKRSTNDVLPTDPFANVGPVLDPEARAAYAQRLTELREELDQASAWNDPERAARAATEIDALTHQLAAAVGLGGRERMASSAAERARLSVTRAIRAALSRIGEQSPALGSHLDATIRTGTFCSYLPDPRVPISWEL